jgi:DNA polymerase III alpha subunit (gram-positive type)
VVAGADPALTTAATLEGIDTALSNADGNLTQLEANPAVITTVEQFLEEALTSVAPLVASTPLLAERAESSGETFDTALTDTVKAVAEKAEALDQELQELEERRKEKADELAAEDEQRREQLQTAIDGLTSRVDTETQRLDTLVPEFESQFSEQQDARKQEFEALRDESKQQVETTIKDLTESAEATSTKLTEVADEALEKVKGRLEEVEKLHGVIADTSTTGAFREEAKTQKKAADKWRVVAVGFGITAAVLAVGAIILSAVNPDAASSAGAIVAKVTATLVAAGIAAYAGRQSGRHRQREEEAKQLELELVAFPPFIESLEDDQKREVRQAFAERAFKGRPTEIPHRSLFRKEDSFGLGVPEVAAVVAAVLRQVEKSDKAGGQQ